MNLNIFKKTLITLILIFISCDFCISSEDVKNKETEYDSLLKRVKKLDKKVKFKDLRISFTKTANYKPYSVDENKQAMIKAFKSKQYEEALKYAELVLDVNYVDIDTHLICRAIYKELKKTKEYKFYDFMANELINSILNSGDGLSSKTAYTVIYPREEEIVISKLGLKIDKQSLIESDGHYYDKINVTKTEFAEESVIYFNVDIPLNWMEEQLKK